jgi:protein-S-isoprenylcysteine O-methyltransferase Ste14
VARAGSSVTWSFSLQPLDDQLGQSRIIRGISARAAQRLVYVGVTLFVVCLVGFVASDSGWLALWRIPGGTVSLLTVGGAVALFTQLTQLFTFSRQRAETAAGYTTMRKGFLNLDQVDPRTGSVIRLAQVPSGAPTAAI